MDEGFSKIEARNSSPIEKNLAESLDDLDASPELKKGLWNE